jgi:hypothetical protein
MLIIGEDRLQRGALIRSRQVSKPNELLDAPRLTIIKGGNMEQILVYDRLCEIPTKIREHAERELKNDPKAYAHAKQDELLMTWLTTLPWQLSFIREIEIGSKRNGVTLCKWGFLGKVIAIPKLSRSGFRN